MLKLKFLAFFTFLILVCPSKLFSQKVFNSKGIDSNSMHLTLAQKQQIISALDNIKASLNITSNEVELAYTGNCNKTAFNDIG